MFNLTNELILKKSSQNAYNSGKLYYKTNRINSVAYNQKNNSFHAEVSGTEIYDIDITFDRNGHILHADCNCHAYYSYSGYCKHISAVLIMIMEKDVQGYFNDIKVKTVTKQIFGFFQNRLPTAYERVTLETTLEFKRSNSHNSHIAPSLNFKIGTDKLYVLRSVKKFLECLEKGTEMELGKKFAFDPQKHELSKEDRQILDFVSEIYEIEKMMESMSYNYSYSKSSLFKDKQVFLSNTSLKRFLDMHLGKNIKGDMFDGYVGDILVIDGDFPATFTLKKDGSDLILDIGINGKMMPLTENGDYFYNQGKIYKPTKEQQESFKPFFMAMSYQKDTKLRFVEEDKERFVSEVLPFAEKAGKLDIDEKVQSLIERIDLVSEIYLDRDEDSITAEVKFKYGERIINPFSHHEYPSDPTGKILIRDVQKETMILDLFSLQDFKVKNNRIYLSGDDEIYSFVLKTIPALQEQSTVFYSESFKTMSIKTTVTFGGKVRLNTENDMLEFSFNLDGIDKSDLSSVLAAMREKKKYYQLKNGSFLNLEAHDMHQLSDFLDKLEFSGADLSKDIIELPKYRAMYLDQSIRDMGFHTIERSHLFKEFVQNIKEPEDMEFELPSDIIGTLRDYQKIGFKWLKTLSAYGMGGILADDMGLGKTLQIITMIASEKENSGSGVVSGVVSGVGSGEAVSEKAESREVVTEKIVPSLIVVPTSLVYNWAAELDKFAPNLKYTLISGNKLERQQLMDQISNSDVVITSYPLIRRDIEEYKNFNFRFCIIDEAQHIKNPSSQNARSVKAISSQRRFALTGTPMENSLSDLWSIFDFALPGYLYSHASFAQKFETPIVKDSNATVMSELSKQIKPFILRRLKTDVLRELPEKIENRLVADLSDAQKKLYIAYLQKVRGEIDKEIKENGFEKSQIKILAALTRLRQLCCHPALFVENYEGGSGKLELLQEVIYDSIGAGHRILLFSQFTSMLQIIKNWLVSEKIDYMYLDGSTPSEERGSLVKSFNEGNAKIFLISLKAGGTGLNLTGADTVIHYDPWWNPAVEDQATDRAYRIGQQKSVHVMKLITKGTIEEKIYNLQEKKKKLIDSVIQPGETLISKLTREELESLFV